MTTDVLRHRVAGAGAEDDGVGDAVAAEAIRAVDAAGVFAGGEEAFDVRAAVDVDPDAAHVVVGAGADFDAVVHQVEAVLAAAVDHAGEVFGDVLDVGRVDEDAAAGRAAAGHDFHVAGCG